MQTGMACLFPRLSLPQGPRNSAADPVADGHVGDHRVDTAGAGEDARVGDVEAIDAPDLAVGIDDAGARVGAHAARAHLVGGGIRAFGRVEPAFADGGKPCLEAGVVDAFGTSVGIIAVGVVGIQADKGFDGFVAEEDFRCALHVGDLGEREDAFERVLLIKCAGRVVDSAAAVDGVGEHAAGVTVPDEGDVAGSEGQLRGAKLNVKARVALLEG